MTPLSLSDILAKHQAAAKVPSALPSVRPSAAAAFNFLTSSLQKKAVSTFGTLNEGYDKDLKPSPCDDVHILLASIDKKVQLSQSAKDGFIMMMATAISLRVDGPFLWTHITGPSSSLKSTLLNLIAAAYDRVFSCTKFKGFYSGSTVGGKDNGLVPQVQDKLFIIHDFTPIIQGPSDVQDEICTDFRVIYEGEGQANFKNGVTHDYRNVRFACLTGVTHEIYKFRRSDMGERFSIFDLNSIWTEDGLYKKLDAELDAAGNAFDSMVNIMSGGFQEVTPPKMDQLLEERQMAWGLLNHLFEYIDDEGTGLRAVAKSFGQDRRLKAEIDALGVWLEHGRCNLPPKGDPYAVMTPAEPHRSIKILIKYAMCLCIVLKQEHATDEVRRLLRKLAFDTAKGKGMEIMIYLALHPLTTKKLLGHSVGCSDTWIGIWCDHLVAIGVLEEGWVTTTTAGAGRQSMCYALTMKFRMIADTIGLHVRLPTVSASQQKIQAVLTARVPRPFGRRPD